MSAWERQGHSLGATGQQLGGTSGAKRNKILCLFAPQVSHRRRPAVPKVSRRSRRHESGGLAEGRPTRWSLPYGCAPHPQPRRSRGKSMRLTWILCNSRADCQARSRHSIRFGTLLRKVPHDGMTTVPLIRPLNSEVAELPGWAQPRRSPRIEGSVQTG